MICHAIHREAPGRSYSDSITRKAFRAVIRRGAGLLLIYSTAVGDYKFPGGGQEPGETEEETLRREVLEESGYLVSLVGAPLYRVEESRQDKSSENTLFTMVSTYYECSVLDERRPQRLERYEEDLGFKAHWVSLDMALDMNRRIRGKATGRIPAWIEREIWVMEDLRRR